MSLYKGTDLISGHQVLYSTTGSNTDGAMTQDAVSDILRYSNVAKMGTVEDNNHVLSSFSTTNYAIIPNTFQASIANTWEMVFKVTTGLDTTINQYFIGSTGIATTRDNVIIGIYEGNFYASFNTSETATTTIPAVFTTYAPEPEITYTIKVEFTGSEYNLYVDNTLQGTATSSDIIYDAGLIIGVQSSSNGVLLYPWLGTVDLNDSYININGNRWWTGVDSSNNFDQLIQTPPFTSKMDGQWVNSTFSPASSYVDYPTADDISYSLSSYLPKDGYNYEVIFHAITRTGSTSGNYVLFTLGSQILPYGVTISGVTTRTASIMYSAGACIIPVGTNRTVSVIATNVNNGGYRLYARGYRRMGTNS